MTNIINHETDEIITCAVAALGGFVSSTITRPMETIRVARVLYALLQAGCSVKAPLVQNAKNGISSPQRKDGGWSDPEESAWAIGVLSQVGGVADSCLNRGQSWLNSVRHTTGGWGRHPRDISRIPTTALVMTLVPDMADEPAFQWITTEWSAEMASPVQLSYKAGFFLLAVSGKQPSSKTELVDKTIANLIQAQNDDGGFGPWKDHPVGSDPWSTGVVLWGLSHWADHVETKVFENGLGWLKETQIDCGLWPYHYLDDGTSMALIGAAGTMKILARR